MSAGIASPIPRMNDWDVFCKPDGSFSETSSRFFKWLQLRGPDVSTMGVQEKYRSPAGCAAGHPFRKVIPWSWRSQSSLRRPRHPILLSAARCRQQVLPRHSLRLSGFSPGPRRQSRHFSPRPGPERTGTCFFFKKLFDFEFSAESYQK